MEIDQAIQIENAVAWRSRSRSDLSSYINSDPKEYSYWIESLNGNALRSQCDDAASLHLATAPDDDAVRLLRVDIPLATPRDSGEGSSDGNLHTSQNRVSLYGHCTPVAIQLPSGEGDPIEDCEMGTPAELPVSSRAQWKDTAVTHPRERLIRLLEREQQWYDLQIEAREKASELIRLVEHHQNQWIQPIR